MSEPSDATPPESAKNDPYRGTLNLPQTTFAMKANLIQREPQFQERWAKLGLYERTLAAPHPHGDFVFHDGPPYANGPIHLGHLLNKVMKDFVVRSRTMMGHRVDYVPGWDCHGLPIEHKVMKDLGKEARTLSTLEIRKRCQADAQKFVALQGKQMQRLGTHANYAKPYLTMTPEFEAGTLEVFAGLVEQGLVYRALKPVHWSIANRTALAEAELEYEDREDKSIYVRFPVVDSTKLPAGLKVPRGAKVDLLVWTTTPWTLPANLAIAVNPRGTYRLVSCDAEVHYAIIVDPLVDKVASTTKRALVNRLGTCTGAELAASGATYQHPFCERVSKIVTAEYVTFEDGTGLVHTAPGHGVEDYQTGLACGLDIYCPVQADGRYDDTVPEWLRGVDVWKANELVIEHLGASGHLLYDHVFTHSYPHDWRSKTPTIFRATHQWFIAVDKPLARDGKSLRELALYATDELVRFVPDWGANRMRGMLEARPDWCISRQRAWGLPIPAFLNERGEALLTPASVRAVTEQVRRHGSDIFFTASPAELLASYDVSQDPHAPAWAKTPGALAGITKGGDIFDVWFESGSSWNAVLRQRGIGFPAELYLEGSDQHRGWFQLSMLPALGVTGQPPFKSVLTHGFMVDAQGRKMSKSLGNALEVDTLLGKYGADICRWWVSSLNYAADIKVDLAYFEHASEEYRKVRNTIRFLLANLYDFDPVKDARPLTDADAHTLDAWARHRLDVLVNTCLEGYESFQFKRVREAIFDFCNDTLSAVVLAAAKDRLYCEAPNSPRRRRTQTVMFEIADALIRLVAPVLVHTADEAYLALHRLEPTSERCVHLTRLPEKRFAKPAPQWDVVMALRSRAQKAVEEAKSTLGIANPLDAGIEATLAAEEYATAEPFAAELADLCGVSRFALRAGAESAVRVVDLRAEPRCVRSWKRDGTVRVRKDGNLLSDRDASVVGLA